MPELEKKVEYKAWAGYDPSAADGNLKEETVQAKTPDDDDIDGRSLWNVADVQSRSCIGMLPRRVN